MKKTFLPEKNLIKPIQKEIDLTPLKNKEVELDSTIIEKDFSTPLIENNLGETTFSEADYTKMDLVDLINQPAWKTILLDLVESEKMNPWDIDVIVLSEKYLKKINELEDNNLRVPANAILACAILVKTKSKYLKLSSIEEEEEKEVITEEEREEMLATIPDLMSERLSREGRITLDELVLSIEGIIQRTKPKKISSRVVPKIEINFDSISIEDKLDGIHDLIKQKIDSQGIVLFRDLISSNDSEELLDVFLPMLFLMHKGKIIAYQNEFFGEIIIKLIEENNLEQTPSPSPQINSTPNLAL